MLDVCIHSHKSHCSLLWQMRKKGLFSLYYYTNLRWSI